MVLGLNSDFASYKLCDEGKMPFEVIGPQGTHLPPSSLGCCEDGEVSEGGHSAHSRHQINERVFLILRASLPCL